MCIKIAYNIIWVIYFILSTYILAKKPSRLLKIPYNLIEIHLLSINGDFLRKLNKFIPFN